MTTQAGQSATIALLTPAAVAEVLGCSYMHVYRLIATGDLRAVDISQRGARRTKTRVRRDDLTAYVESRTRSARPTPPAA